MTVTSAIRVTPDQLRSMGSRVTGAANQINDETRAMHSALSPLGSDWAGNASVQYQALMQEWTAADAKVQEALRGISALLTQAGHAYDQADGYIAGTFRR